jgi:hypothetical protein
MINWLIFVRDEIGGAHQRLVLDGSANRKRANGCLSRE